MASKTYAQCTCSDPGCAVHIGKSECSNTTRLVTLYRVDMEDRTGSPMCPACREDAMESGLFDTSANFYSR